MPPVTLPRARLKAKAIQWLAGREHSTTELRTKLQRWARKELLAADRAVSHDGEAIDRDEAQSRWAAIQADIDTALEELQGASWLSEARFVESRVRARSSGFGNRRITYELAQHGLSLSAEETQALAANELERAQRLIESRHGGPASDPRERARQQRFLAGRGFSAEVISRALKRQEDPR
jgi:regulatory protein